jgi:hypothetical protein
LSSGTEFYAIAMFSSEEVRQEVEEFVKQMVQKRMYEALVQPHTEADPLTFLMKRYIEDTVGEYVNKCVHEALMHRIRDIERVLTQSK